MNLKNPFTSRRVRKLPDPEAPSPFAVGGGWGEAHEAAGVPLDPLDSERAQRVAGAVALAQFERENAERKRAEMDARLAGVARGRDYSRGLAG
jgi:hypothetical protein